MKQLQAKVIAIGGVLLLCLSLASFINWSRFDQVEADVFDITFAGGEESQIIEYVYGDVGFEAEYILTEEPDGATIQILVEPEEPGNFQLAPTPTRRNLTLLVGVVGGMFALSPALLDRKS